MLRFCFRSCILNAFWIDFCCCLQARTLIFTAPASVLEGLGNFENNEQMMQNGRIWGSKIK